MIVLPPGPNGFRPAFCVFIWGLLVLCPLPGLSVTLHGNPDTYSALVKEMKPGDTLILAPGMYRHDLRLHGLSGTREQPIVIRGARGRHRTVFLARSGHNTVSIANAAYLEIHDLVLDGRGLLVDAVKAEGPSRWAHHITLDGLVIYGYDADQQNVGISTKCPAWGWVVRDSVIYSAGTGMYFGRPDGSAPFFDGLIEHNVVVDTVGYNIEIKQQNDWPKLPLHGPRSRTTIIRYNVFSKAHHGAAGHMARPNVLLDHWPPSGPGTGDIYQVYGNFFYQNPTERLFQGEGNIALYDNLFVNDDGDAVSLQYHHGPPQRIEVFDNTVVASGGGIAIYGADPAYRQRVFANAVFAAVPLHGGERDGNVTDTYGRAGGYLKNPGGVVADEAAMQVRLIDLQARRDDLLAEDVLGTDLRVRGLKKALRRAETQYAERDATKVENRLDLHPRPGRLSSPSSSPVVPYSALLDADRDFNGAPRHGRFRGAYAGEGNRPGWTPTLARIPSPLPPE